MTPAPTTVRELAEELRVSPKAVRAWMRRQGWRSLVESGQPWLLTPEQVTRLRDRFREGESVDEAPSVPGADVDFLSEQTVEELLVSHRNILGSLRSRGLVRTNNAPIGDLAEYCAAIVYDGLLAPNSEKSYDLVAEDGRRIQVKVRLIRRSTSRGAVFSPLRSFGFDACLFLLVDDEGSDVELACELSVDEVRQHGKYRDHTNGTVVTIGPVRAHGIGVDMTAAFRAAWRELLSRRS